MRSRRNVRTWRPVFEPLEDRAVPAVMHAGMLHHSVARPSAARSAIVRPRDVSLVPITDLGPGMTYQGQVGGLYRNGQNSPPQTLRDAADEAAARVVPLNRWGLPSAKGKVGVVAVGQSTTQQWFAHFQSQSRSYSTGATFVNAAQDGVVSQTWSSSFQPWANAREAIAGSGLARAQVQVLILDSVRMKSWQDGDLESQIKAYQSDLTRIIARAKSEYPNLSLVYMFPFHYAGFASNARATREPFAYQLAFGIRQVILDQKAQASPVLVWGPYVWSETMSPGYYYDAIHFTTLGRKAMANLAWSFFQTDQAAARWLWRRSGPV